MADDAQPSPLANLITEAREGRLNVRMEPEEFAKIDHECENFKELVIREIQRTMTEISQITTWGIGDHAGSQLTSAPTMAQRFREKAQGGPDSFYDVLEEHYRIVEDIRLLHQEVRNRFMGQDGQWAARFQAELTSLEQGPQR
ncbi:hypothetical protein ACQPW1_39350 [Nocardia sp. CA-128927]|uniref:hypothetical protein n=1 Tax=Nocardia sp. CA-128927 TaxID=3239975 RepID=UPI003D97B397